MMMPGNSRPVVCALLLAAGTASALEAPGRADLGQRIQARACLLVDAGTGKVLFSRNADAAYPPASTVKLMTALLAYEKTALRGSARVAAADTRVEPSHVPLRAGEEVSVRDMTRTLLVGSDNDSAMFLARVTAGSTGEFLRLMDERAHELGCARTVFKNPNGLPAKGQVSTCRDLLKIFQAVVRVPELRQYCMTRGFELRTAVGKQWVKNHNKLLGVYDGMGPAKTGWTYASRHTYTAAAARDGRELHLVILNSPDKWTDARLLFDYGFAQPREPAAPHVPVAGLPSPRHVVQRGDTLSSIARRYGVSVEAVTRANTLSDPDHLAAGMALVIPVR